MINSVHPHFTLAHNILIEVAQRGETISYKELAQRLGTPTHGHALGKVLGPILDEINMWSSARGIPLVSSVVVRTSGPTAGYPGDGFYRLCQRLGYYCPKRDDSVERKIWTDSYLAHVWRFWGTGSPIPV